MNPYQQHQHNCSQFFDYALKITSGINCQSGCYQCCLTDISIFTWEASLIEKWFQDLSREDKDQLITKWSLPKEKEIDLNGNYSAPCVFLHQKKCSIYNSRPIICRTQGLSLQVENQQSHCPLNFTEGPASEKSTISLDRVNTISAILQKKYSNDNIKSVDQQRISLKKLQKNLINNL